MIISNSNLPGLYVHVPFCQTKCPYCDFYSITSPDLIPAYLSALEKEAQLYSAKMPSKGGTGVPACAAPAELSWTANVSPPSMEIPPAPFFQRGVKSPPLEKGDLGGFAFAQAKQSCSTLSTHENESRVGGNLVFALGEYKIRSYNHTSFISFDTLYLGGGTPSLLDGEQLTALVNKPAAAFRFCPGHRIHPRSQPGRHHRGETAPLAGPGHQPPEPGGAVLRRSRNWSSCNGGTRPGRPGGP